MKIKLREYQKQDFKALETGTTSRKRTHKIDKF